MNVITVFLMLWLFGILTGYLAAELNWRVWREK